MPWKHPLASCLTREVLPWRISPACAIYKEWQVTGRIRRQSKYDCKSAKGPLATHITSEQIDDALETHTHTEHGHLAHRPSDDIPTDPRIGSWVSRPGRDDDGS
jgi:hypothetical protein